MSDHLTSSPSQGEFDENLATEFVFSDHSKELIVGEIFVRVYNEQPTFALEVGMERPGTASSMQTVLSAQSDIMTNSFI